MMRRRDKRPLIIGAFIAAFVFGFLTARFKPTTEPVDATSTTGFDAGNIISDYVMSNYSSMTEAEIQAFLTSKNSCSNTSYSDYQYYTTKYPNLKWHWQDGHFVCLSQELFGDGEVIGSGETAAHIIWQAAQDYRINPQVLIVLLQKEQGLITDTYPNDRQYRAATGYGCPDTAACSTKYYGFKNQVRNAAAMFRTVLDGGWTNYPLGENYIQYNPDANCGGSVVNIKSLATSALYRYTPYQPNAGALAAGYGTAYCGSYGNRNFYLYFTDWFGKPNAALVEWSASTNPRYMITTDSARIYDPDKKEWTAYAAGQTFYFDEKTTVDDALCIRPKTYRTKASNKCFAFDGLVDYEPQWSASNNPRYLTIQDDVSPINAITLKSTERSTATMIFFNVKATLPDDTVCVRNDTMPANICYPIAKLKELPSDYTWQKSTSPRLMAAKTKVRQLDILTGETTTLTDFNASYFSTKITTPSGVCVRSYDDSNANKNTCIIFTDLQNVPGGSWSPSISPRVLIAIDDVNYTSLSTLDETEETAASSQLYNQRIQLPDGKTCVRNQRDDAGTCVVFEKLNEQP